MKETERAIDDHFKKELPHIFREASQLMQLCAKGLCDHHWHVLELAAICGLGLDDRFGHRRVISGHRLGLVTFSSTRRAPAQCMEAEGPAIFQAVPRP